MRFVFLSLGYHPDLIGGAYRYVTETAERLAGRGHEVEVVFPNPKNILAPDEVRNGVHLKRIQDGTGFFWNNWRTENRAAAQALLGMGEFRRTVIVLAHSYFAPVIRRLRSPAVFLFTGPWSAEYALACSAHDRLWWRRVFDKVVQRRMRAIECRALRSVRRILTISRYYERMLPTWHGDRISPTSVISAGVDLKGSRQGSCPLGCPPRAIHFSRRSAPGTADGIKHSD